MEASQQVKKEDLERAILDLWLTTQIPLTRAHLQYHTGLNRKRLNEWLDELVLEGVLGVDVTDDGEMVYEVAGASRPGRGPRTFAEGDRLGALDREVRQERAGAGRGKRDRDRGGSGLGDLQAELVMNQAHGLIRHAGKSMTRTKDGDKSLAASGALSVLFGPLGWFYAGSVKEAAIGSVVFLAFLKILPSFMLPLLFLGLPISGVLGVIYAWQHNRTGHRQRLLGGKSDDDE